MPSCGAIANTTDVSGCVETAETRKCGTDHVGVTPKINGFGEVYVYSDMVVKQARVGIKGAVKSLLNEFTVLQELASCKGVIDVYWYEEDAVSPSLYMQNGGTDLLDMIDANEYFCKHSAMRQMVAALHEIHRKGFAHLDLKLENVCIDKVGHISIIDFGFAKQAGAKYVGVCGSEGYCAPEIINGSPYDPQLADIWSLGVIAFALEHHRSPWRVAIPRGPKKDEKYCAFEEHRKDPDITSIMAFKNIYNVKFTNEVIRTVVNCALHPVPEQRILPFIR